MKPQAVQMFGVGGGGWGGGKNTVFLEENQKKKQRLDSGMEWKGLQIQRKLCIS